MNNFKDKRDVYSKHITFDKTKRSRYNTIYCLEEHKLNGY